MLTIGELGKRTDTKIETIRYYEKTGILSKPARTEANYRLYDTADLQRLSFVRRARNLGFSLQDIRALLSLYDDRTQSCTAVDALAHTQLRSIDQKIADLKALRRELATLVENCGGGSVAECRIIEALGSIRTEGKDGFNLDRL